MSRSNRTMPWQVVSEPFKVQARIQELNRIQYASCDYKTFPISAGSVAAMAEVLGVAPRSVHRWRNGQPVLLSTAERIADRVGRHPADLWGDCYWQAVGVAAD